MKKTVCMVLSIILLLILLLSGCGRKADKDAANNATSEQTESSATQNMTETTTEDPEKAYVKKGYIIADNVNIRTGPGLSSEVIDMLGIGDRVDIAGRGDALQRIGEYEGYWYNVKYRDINGWCFGEYVSGMDELDEKLVSRFENFISMDGVGINDAMSVLYKFTQLTGNKEVVDDCVRQMTKLQNKLVPQYQQELWGLVKNFSYSSFLEAWNNPGANDSELNKKIRQLSSLGYSIYLAEGTPYLEPDPGYYIEKFGTDVSEGMKLYLELKAVETKKRMGTEGFLTISWDELSDRIAAWEKYVSDYPDMPETGEAEKTYRNYLGIYVYGSPYTPIYDPDTNKVKDEVIDSYERFIEKYPASNVREIIKGYYDILKADNFKVTEKSQEYLRKALDKG